MAGFLDQYGAGDERRARNLKRIIASVLSLAVVAGLVYFFFHNYPEERQAKRFFNALAAHDYQAAYNIWAPTEAAKHDYPMEAFMRDWGPNAQKIGKFSIVEDESCDNSVIMHVDTGGAKVQQVWVNRDNLRMTFPPDERGCVRTLVDGNGQLFFQNKHTRFYQWFRNLKYKMHGRTPD